MTVALFDTLPLLSLTVIVYGPGASAIAQPLLVQPVGLPLASTVNDPLPPLQLTIAPELLLTADAVIGLAAVKLKGTV